MLLCDSNLSLARAAFADGLSADHEASVLKFLRDTLCLAASTRSSVKDMLANLDGRRRLVRNEVKVMPISPETKHFDHLIACVPLWAQAALTVGDAFLQLVRLLAFSPSGSDQDSEQHTPENEDNVTKSLEIALLAIPLLGRPPLLGHLKSGTHQHHLRIWQGFYSQVGRMTKPQRDSPIINECHCTRKGSGSSGILPVNQQGCNVSDTKHQSEHRHSRRF